MLAVHVRTTVRLEPAHETVREIDPGVVGAVVSRMIDLGVSDHGDDESYRARPETVLRPSPAVKVQAAVELLKL